MEEQLYKKASLYSKFEFLFLSLLAYLLKNCSSQFFSNWKSAEPVFCSEELSFLPYKNQNKSLTLSFGEGKFKLKNWCHTNLGVNTTEIESKAEDNFSASSTQLYILAGVYLACSILSAVVVAVFVDPLSK